MLKTYLYIPDDLASKIDNLVIKEGRPKASLIRDAMYIGVEQLQKKRNNGYEFMKALVELGESVPLSIRKKWPKDGSINHDKYLWDTYKKDYEKKP